MKFLARFTSDSKTTTTKNQNIIYIYLIVFMRIFAYQKYSHIFINRVQTYESCLDLRYDKAKLIHISVDCLIKSCQKL